MPTNILEIGGNKYSIGRISPNVGMKLVLKLAPLMKGMTGLDAGALFAKVPDNTPEDEKSAAKLRRDVAAKQAISSLLAGLGEMNEHVVDEIQGICLGVVQRQVPGGAAWSPIWVNTGNGQGSLVYEDITIPELFAILGRVLMDNLLSFTPALRP